MSQDFEDELADLIKKHRDAGLDVDTIISALEIAANVLEEEA
jgi:hypothetical protein